MTDDYKRGLITGLAMQPLCVVSGILSAKRAAQDTIVGGIALNPLSVAMVDIAAALQTQTDVDNTGDNEEDDT